MSHRKAVEAALVVVGKIKSGIDPNLEKRQQQRKTEEGWSREKLTVQVVFTEYLERKKAVSKANTHRDREVARDRLSAGRLWKLPLLEVKGSDLIEEYDRLKSTANPKRATNGGATFAGGVMRIVRAAFQDALSERELEVPNPFAKLNDKRPKWYRANARKRTVGDGEGQLARWWSAVDGLRGSNDKRATDSATIADYLTLAILFGGRKTETLSLKWSDVDLGGGIVRFRKEVTKSGVEHAIPFGSYARSLLERRKAENDARSEPSLFVFNASRRGRDKKDKVTGEVISQGARTYIKEPKGAMRKVVAAAGIDFASHDLRRTFATLFEELGVSTITIEKALNHAQSTTAGQHYVHLRTNRLRHLYQDLENKILIEAGVMKAIKPETSEISPEELVEFRKWQAQSKHDASVPDNAEVAQ